jgi:WD40 repeat protein
MIGSSRFSGALWGPQEHLPRCLLSCLVESSGRHGDELSRMVIVSGDCCHDGAEPGDAVPVTLSYECVYSYCWRKGARNELVRSSDGESSGFLVAARGLPVHLYALSNETLEGILMDRGGAGGGAGGGRVSGAVSEGCSLVGSFVATDTWSDTGENLYSVESAEQRVYAGSEDAVYCWDVTRPGKETIGCMRTTWDDQYHEDLAHDFLIGGRGSRVSARRRKKGSIMSTLAMGRGSTGAVLAAGSYAKRVGLFDIRTNQQTMFLDQLSNAVTALKFAGDGNYLFVGTRGQGVIHCFDVRNQRYVYEIVRGIKDGLKQKVLFDVGWPYVMSGAGLESNEVKVWDGRDGREVWQCKDSNEDEDVINECAWREGDVWAITSGSRFPGEMSRDCHGEICRSVRKKSRVRVRHLSFV